jgi:hypothetical protein
MIIEPELVSTMVHVLMKQIAVLVAMHICTPDV